MGKSMPIRALFLFPLIFVILFISSCGNIAASYTPPVPFPPITFTIDQTGTISLHVDPKLVTEIGTFSLSDGVSASLQPEDHSILIIIRHRQDGTVIDTAYKIQTDQNEVTVVVDGKTTIQVTNRKVFIDASDGSVKSIEVEGKRVSKSFPFVTPSPIKVINIHNVIYHSKYSHSVYALSLIDGSILWRYQVNNSIYIDPIVANGIVYFAGNDNFVYALNANNGTLLWRYKTGNTVISSPVISSGNIYIGSDDGYLYALNAKSGSFIWRAEVGSTGNGPPVVVNGIIFISSNDLFTDDKSFVEALNTSDGSILWRFHVGARIIDGLAESNSMIYAASQDGYVYALTDNGSLVWKYQLETPPTYWFESRLLINNGAVYVGWDGGTMSAFNSTNGTLLWQFVENGGGPVSSPMINDGVIYFAAGFHSLYAIHANNGLLLWKHEGNNDFQAPIFMKATIYAYSFPYLYAFQAMDGTLLWHSSNQLS